VGLLIRRTAQDYSGELAAPDRAQGSGRQILGESKENSDKNIPPEDPGFLAGEEIRWGKRR